MKSCDSILRVALKQFRLLLICKRPIVSEPRPTNNSLIYKAEFLLIMHFYCVLTWAIEFFLTLFYLGSRLRPMIIMTYWSRLVPWRLSLNDLVLLRGLILWCVHWLSLGLNVDMRNFELVIIVDKILMLILNYITIVWLSLNRIPFLNDLAVWLMTFNNDWPLLWWFSLLAQFIS